ncbi:MAG: (2E,6E)-farnesyl diphosphate synthase [Gammaproteobacteria bacterium]|nr:(2E,6E)-farnesyl diphosphate synthase [Gammaproteobacteria bacterium]
MNLSNAIELYKTQTESFLTNKINSADIEDPRLKEAMEYSLLLGGKRLRPFLVYATGQMFSATLSDLDAPAAALEAIHTYSLIHDDLPAMDDDALRRGKPTNHKQFDEATAILAGDTLQTFAFQLLADHKYQNVNPAQIIKMFSVLSQASIDMCAGQSIDLQQTDTLDNIEKNQDALARLKNMHRLKTGALIKASVKLGAIAGNANEGELEILSNYADAVGLAFQVWDDVLDITSDTETLGKPQGSDLDANKMTYPALIGLQDAKNKATKLIDEAVQALGLLPYNTAELKLLAQYIIERDH